MSTKNDLTNDVIERLFKLVQEVTTASVNQAKTTEELQKLISVELVEALQVQAEQIADLSSAVTTLNEKKSCHENFQGCYNTTMIDLKLLTEQIKKFITFIKVLFGIVATTGAVIGCWQAIDWVIKHK